MSTTHKMHKFEAETSTGHTVVHDEAKYLELTTRVVNMTPQERINQVRSTELGPLFAFYKGMEMAFEGICDADDATPELLRVLGQHKANVQMVKRWLSESIQIERHHNERVKAHAQHAEEALRLKNRGELTENWVNKFSDDQDRGIWMDSDDAEETISATDDNGDDEKEVGEENIVVVDKELSEENIVVVEKEVGEEHIAVAEEENDGHPDHEMGGTSFSAAQQ
jgi:hypothetical protein